MNEQIKQVAENLAQVAVDLMGVRMELLLNDEYDIYEAVPELLFSTSNDLVDRYRTLTELMMGEEEDSAEVDMDAALEPYLEDEGVIEEDVFDVVEAIEFDERSLTQFAKDAGITRDTLKRFMGGMATPHAKTLRGIERALGLKEGSLDE